MKIMFLAAYPPFPAGEGHYAGCVVEAMARLSPGDDVRVLGFEVGSGERSGIRTAPLVAYVLKEGRFARHFNWARILWYLISWRPDVVHSQGIHTPRYGGIFGELSLIALSVARLAGIRIVTTMHATWGEAEFKASFAHRLPVWAANLLWIYYRAFIRSLARISNVCSVAGCGTGRTATTAMASAFGADLDFTIEKHPCVQRQPVRQNHRRESSGPVGGSCYSVVAYGFIRPDKGYDLFAGAASRLLRVRDDVRFTLAGSVSGSCSSEHIAALRHPQTIDAERYRFVEKYLSDEEMDTVLRSADILVLPYRRSIGPSGPMHHALGAGVAVVATPVGYNCDMCDVCVILPDIEVDSLVRALEALLDQPDRLADSRLRAVKYAESNTWDRLARLYINFYLKQHKRS